MFGFEEIQFECINFGALCLANRWRCGVKPMVIKKARDLLFPNHHGFTLVAQTGAETQAMAWRRY